MENVQNRLELDFIKKDDFEKNTKQESKLTFIGIHKLYENCDSYVLKKMKL